tara:strand:- start:37 stop:1050 length:1014 start_codon:yes stop_codon:yes gene_type:complete
MTQHYPVPLTDNSSEWKLILEKMVDPVTFVGLKFKKRHIMRIVDVEYIDPVTKENKNIGRANTGERDSYAFQSFKMGIDPNQQPPKICEGTAFGGYGRKKIFDKLGYPVWVFDEYEYDKKSYTKQQKRDILRDAANDDNGYHSPAKRNSKDDYLMIMVDNIKEKNWTEDDCKKWLKSRKQYLSPETINNYVRDSFKRKNALGRIEPLDETEARLIRDKSKINAHLINTTDAHVGNRTRISRKMPHILKNYVDSKGEIQEFCAWNGNAGSHQELDDSLKAIQDHLKQQWKTILQVVDTYNFNVKHGFIKEGEIPFKITHLITQKLGMNIPVREIKSVE